MDSNRYSQMDTMIAPMSGNIFVQNPTDDNIHPVKKRILSQVSQVFVDVIPKEGSGFCKNCSLHNLWHTMGKQTIPPANPSFGMTPTINYTLVDPTPLSLA